VKPEPEKKEHKKVE
jgi:hypothetical protein